MFTNIYIKSKPNFSISEFEREVFVPEQKSLETDEEAISKVGIQTLAVQQEQNPIGQNIRLNFRNNNKPQFKTKLYNILDLKRQEENKKHSTINEEKDIFTNEIVNDPPIIFSPFDATKEELKEFLNQFPNDNDKKFLQFITLLNPLYEMANGHFDLKINPMTKEEGLNRNQAAKVIQNCIDILIEQKKYQYATRLLEKCLHPINTRFQIFIRKTYNTLAINSPEIAHEFEKYCEGTSNKEIKEFIRKQKNCVNNQPFSITNEKGVITIKNF